MKIIYILITLLFFTSCFKNAYESCKKNSDCPFESECIENECIFFTPCFNSADCGNYENCIDGKCKISECMSESQCGEDENCVDFKCVSIQKKSVGETCYDFGNDECYSGYCLSDLNGSYCSEVCSEHDDCPNNMACNPLYADFYFCQYGERNGGDQTGGYNSNCEINGQSDCAPQYTCVRNIYNRNQDRCLPQCYSDDDCYLNFDCVYHNDGNAYCMPPKYRHTGELCMLYNGLECIDENDVCIALSPNEKYCSKTCSNHEECGENNYCKPYPNGLNYCLIEASSQFGEKCDLGGSLQCEENYQCYSNINTIPFCTKECQNDLECGDYFSCSVTVDGKKLCLPAANGLGNRTGSLGESCYVHGDSDCLTNMFCLSGFSGNEKAYCTYHCQENSDCSENYHCADPTRTGNKVCVKGNQGELGSNCANETCNNGLYCHIEHSLDYTGFCTKSCEIPNEACDVEGYYCNQVYTNYYICTNEEPTNTSQGNIGDLCPNGYRDCQSGLNCIFDPNGNFCSQKCSEGVLCPDGFSCNIYDESNSFCYKN